MSSRKKFPKSLINVALSTIKAGSTNSFLSRLRAKYFSVEGPCVEVGSLANRECLNPSNCSPKDQSVNVMCTCVRRMLELVWNFQLITYL